MSSVFRAESHHWLTERPSSGSQMLILSRISDGRGKGQRLVGSLPEQERHLPYTVSHLHVAAIMPMLAKATQVGSRELQFTN